ncbi:BspA family leucine-rich repeat surface protein [Mycoplasma putrefaciens]|uniref:BspA family leucine-rich repeat surface protein n=1 Tax=Mycoplasma putrefaciens TaxID=2123 RepID=UPI003DA45715
MKKKSLVILLSALGGVTVAGVVGGVIIYKTTNRNSFPVPHSQQAYVNQLIKEHNIPASKFNNNKGEEIVLIIKHSEYNKEGTECLEIGYSLTSNKQIQIEEFKPSTKKVPSVLPSHITSLKFAFMKNKSKTIENLEKWNTSGITDMSWMFADAKNFNQKISNWNTSNVRFMRFMFADASKFNQNLSNWNLKNISKDVTKRNGQIFTSWVGFNIRAHSEFKDNKLPKFPK